jgi:uncharacterized membrane protein
MSRLPNIQVYPSTSAKIIGTTASILLIGTWIYIGYIYPSLPQTIASHFDHQGKLDGWSDKSSIIGIPLITSIISAALWYAKQFYRYFNYPVPVTSDNAAWLYTRSVDMITQLRLSLSVIAGLIIFYILRCQSGCQPQKWMLPCVLGVILIPLGYNIYKMVRTT